MGFLYDRTETDDKITIRFKLFALRYAILFFAIGVIIALGLLRDCCSTTIIGIPAIAVLLAYHKWMEVALVEMRKAKKEGRAKISGSRINPWNPLIVEISKTPPPAQALGK